MWSWASRRTRSPAPSAVKNCWRSRRISSRCRNTESKPRRCERVRRNVAVAGLSLAVPRGEVFGFLGPNGAGKTTSLKMLLGLVGRRRAAARCSARRSADRGTCTHRLPARAFPFSRLPNARELLHFHGRLSASRRRARDAHRGAARRVGLTTRRTGRSGPTAGHDAACRPRAGAARLARARVPRRADLGARSARAPARARHHRRAAPGGTTVFLNSHLLGEVEATCDRVAFVKTGLVVHELELGNATGTLDVELRVGRPDDALLEGSRHSAGVKRDEALVRCTPTPRAVLPELARWLVGRGVALYEIRCRRKSLRNGSSRSWAKIRGRAKTCAARYDRSPDLARGAPPQDRARRADLRAVVSHRVRDGRSSCSRSWTRGRPAGVAP